MCGGLRAKDESLERSGSGEAQGVSGDLKMKVFWPREGGLIVAADSSRGRKVLNERCPLCVFQGNLKREKETVAVRCVQRRP